MECSSSRQLTDNKRFLEQDAQLHGLLYSQESSLGIWQLLKNEKDKNN